MRIRNANAGEMVTNVPPTVEALNGGEKKGGGGATSIVLVDSSANTIYIMHLYAPTQQHVDGRGK